MIYYRGWIAYVGYAVWLALLVFVYAPVLMVFKQSFIYSQGSSDILSMGYYVQQVCSISFWKTTANSLFLACLVSLLSCFIGTGAAIFSVYVPGVVSKSTELLIYTILLLPEIMLVMFLSGWYSFMHVPLGFWAILFTHVTFYIGVPFIFVGNGIREIPYNVFLAASDLGMDELAIITQVIFPSIYLEILCSFVTIMFCSLDEFMINYFMSDGAFITLPVYIYNGIKTDHINNMMAVSMILFVLHMIFVLGLYILYKRYKDRI